MDRKLALLVAVTIVAFALVLLSPDIFEPKSASSESQLTIDCSHYNETAISVLSDWHRKQQSVFNCNLIEGMAWRIHNQTSSCALIMTSNGSWEIYDASGESPKIIGSVQNSTAALCLMDSLSRYPKTNIKMTGAF